MKIKAGLISRQMDNEYITVTAGLAGEAFKGMIRSNAMVLEIIKLLENECHENEIVDCLFARYDAPYETIAQDVHRIIEQFRDIGLLDE